MARPRAWADLILNQTMIGGGGQMTPLDILFDLGIVRLDTVTVTRIVGSLMVVPDGSGMGPQGSQRVDVGIGVAGADAFSFGVTGLPNPAASDQYPPRGWLYVTTQVARQDALDNNAQFPRWNFDVRAMRRIDKGILFLAATNSLVIGSAGTLRLVGRVRALCLT